MQQYYTQGEVWLVGAGPGDPGLLTQAGREALEAADVVIHDRLGCEAILEQYAHISAQFINAGKLPGDRRVLQEDINALLHQEAAAGKRVVRLKGGDPFVYGRGFEEYEYLVERGIRTHIVPGVTSALAASIEGLAPATLRRTARSFAIATGHTEDGEIPQTPRADTLFFLMAMGRLERVSEQLLNDGWARETPAAIVTEATTYRRRVLRSTLGSISAQARQHDLQPPGILIVGESAGAAGSLPAPVKSPVVVVTEPQGKPSAALRQQLTNALFLPRPLWTREPLTLAEPGLAGRLEEALAANWIAFQDADSVTDFIGLLLETGRDLRAVTARIAAAGEAAAEALRAVGLIPDLFAANETLLAERLRGERVTLVSSTNETNSNFLQLPVYRLRARQPHAIDWESIDFVSFEREAAVQAFVTAFAEAPFTQLTVLAANARIAEAAKNAGFGAIENIEEQPIAAPENTEIAI